MMTNNDSCDNFCNFCNGEATPLRVIMKQKDYAHNRDCAYSYDYAFGSAPPGMCLYSPEDMEDFDDADTHTSDYIGDV